MLCGDHRNECDQFGKKIDEQSKKGDDEFGRTLDTLRNDYRQAVVGLSFP
jgi:hypothetical protein